MGGGRQPKGCSEQEGNELPDPHGCAGSMQHLNAELHSAIILQQPDVWSVSGAPIIESCNP